MFWRKKDYKVLFDDDWVQPEETLLDSSSEHSDIEQPISIPVFRYFMFIFMIFSFVAVFYIFKLSILDHDYFAKLSFQNKTANFPLPPPRGLILDINGDPLVKNIPSFDLLVITRETKQAKELFQKNSEEIANILNIPVDEFKTLLTEKTKSNAIFFVAESITKDQALAIEFLDPKGFYIISDTVRNYPNGHKFSQVLGYIGKVNKKDLEDDYYFPTDTIGRLGIEGQYEEILRGEHGNIFFTQEKSGAVNKDAEPGKNLVLNIDKDIQEHLHDDIWRILLESNLSKAVGIVQNPKNGAVLGMVSFPGFDNNIFISGVSDLDFKRLFESRSKPLFNRAIGGLFNPGSTIKPFMGLAALEEKLVTPRDTVKDCVSISVGNFVFRNWREEYGNFDLRKAIANSCNVYFFSIGGGYGNIRGLGISRIADYLKKAGADKKTGIDIAGEASGFIPTPEWKEDKTGESWYLGDTYNVSIGQGDLILTPIWLNTYISAIANGGTLYRPQIASRVVDKDMKTVSVFKEEEIGKLPFSPMNILEMRKAMEETVKTGTAKLLSDLPVQVAAKTGTAEVIKGQTINALFVAFAPSDNPELALTILFEGSSSNQGYAIRAADSFLTWYFNKDKKVNVEPLISGEVQP